MQRKVLYFLLLLCLCAGASVTLHAQDTAEQPQNLLPEIDPQDIEIRSQFQARFPGLRRQPILGFNPKPRVFQVDPNRTPFIESEEAMVASLPVGELTRPEAPGYRPLSYADPKNGFARLGIGSFVTPEADIYLIQGIGENNWVSGNLTHRSSDGHIDDYNSSFRNFSADLRSQLNITQKVKLRLNARTFSDFNYLPQNEINEQVGTTAPDVDFGPGLRRSAKSTSYGFQFNGDLAYNRSSISGFQTDFSLYSHEFELKTTGDVPFTLPGEATEWGGDIGLSYSWAGSRVEEGYSVFAGVEAGSIGLLETADEGWSITQAGATYDRLLNYQTDINASFGVAVVSDALDGSTLYITPKLDLRHTLFDGVDLRGHLSGTPTHRSYRQLWNINRFVGLDKPLSHQYTTDLKGELILEPLSGSVFTGGVQFQYIRNYTYFTRAESLFLPGSAPSSEISVLSNFEPNFENATFLKLYGSFSQQLSAEKLWVSADAYWQRPRLSGNEEIPFVESVGIRGAASFRPISQLVLEGWADVSGSRFNPEGDDLSSYVVLGTQFELSLTETSGIYAKLLNINDVSYEVWQGYEERGFQAYLGFTYLF
ncbi:MAG: hypothetical protein GVY08_05475 [Bacteroidetes bacterium]|jgi:hypothetical protein|nr:hypothetical protein [Bacteroidota bacterium]